MSLRLTPLRFARALFQQAIENSPSILFFDDAEGLFRDRRHDKVHSTTLIGELHVLWSSLTLSNHQVLVIGATNRPELLDPLSLSRFGKPVLIPLPNEASKKRLLERGLNIPEIPHSFSSEQLDRLVAEYMDLFDCRTIDAMLSDIESDRLDEMFNSPMFVQVSSDTLLRQSMQQ